MPHPHPFVIALATLAILAIAACTPTSKGPGPRSAATTLPDQDTKGLIDMDNLRAPEFPAGYSWLNTDKPLRFANELKGQIVVMDFWTYCCINCMHVIPDLEAIEQKYKDQPVVVLGVHSAKYDNEEDAANIRAAIQRYDVHHPVIVDQNHFIWDSYAVRSWPTLVVVGADGRIIGTTSGEGNRELLENVIDKALADAKANGTLAQAPLVLPKEGQVRGASGLAFPGKILADPAANRLFIVDSNHNRIVITSWPDNASSKVTVQAIIGSGQTGNADGDFAAATFNRPQGAAIAGNILWVADTENHLIRRVDLAQKRVLTVLGTGKQQFDPEAGKSGKNQPLNSPWDVAPLGNRLYISQAGQHQIFAMNIMTGMTEVAAGTAREDLLDGNAVGESNLAQPSGLALDAKNQILYFADSEVSAIRALDIQTKQIYTLIGHGLFDFGDIDGNPDAARLQHPLGLALSPDNNSLFIADTYNHKIKQIDHLDDPAKISIHTLAGTGKPGAGSMPGAGPLQFFEPASVALAANDLLVADTNNHRIIRFNPADKSWSELTIEGLAAPDAAGEPAADKNAKDAGPFTLPANDPITLSLHLNLPPLTHLTPGAPLSLKITDGSRTLQTASAAADGNAIQARIPAEALATHPNQIYITLYYTYCSQGPAAVCTPAKAAWKISPTFASTGDADLKLAQ